MVRSLPQQSTESVVHQIYRAAWGQHAFGMAGAMALLLFVLLLVFTVPQLRLLGKQADHA